MIVVHDREAALRRRRLDERIGELVATMRTVHRLIASGRICEDRHQADACRWLEEAIADAEDAEGGAR